MVTVPLVYTMLTGGGESDVEEYLNKGYKTYSSYGDKVKVRVDCDNITNTCFSTLLFTAPKYGKSYTISLDGISTNEQGETNNLTSTPISVTTHTPKMLYIDKVSSESNPMLFTLTPKFDTVIPAEKKINLKWNVTGTNISNSSDTWKELDNTSKPNTRSLSHTFSKSGNYVIDVEVTSDDAFDGALSKSEDYDGTILQLDQNITGSYFVHSLNTFIAQVTFNTDYEIRVNGTPVPTTYVYSITGPTKDDLNTSNITKLVVTDKQLITSKNFEENNNVRLLFGATYTVELEVYQTSLYNDGNIDETSKADGVNYKKFTINNINIPKIIINLRPKNNTVINTWYEDILPFMSANGLSVDNSLFTCDWSYSTSSPNSIRIGDILPMNTNNSYKNITKNCSVKMYMSGLGGDEGNVTLYLRVYDGPAIDNNTLFSDNKSMNYLLKKLSR